MKSMFAVAVLAVFFVIPAQAKEMLRAPSSGGTEPFTCSMKEQVTINVNYNKRVKDFTEARQWFDTQQAKIGELAKQQNIKIEIQNQNLSVNSSPNSYDPSGRPDGFVTQMNGSTSYRLDNVDAAFKFAEFLNQQGMQVGLNTNSYRQGNCQ